jgi:hypothetical protein
MKKFFLFFFAIIFCAGFSANVFATVTFLMSRGFSIEVNGQPFVVSGYEGHEESDNYAVFRLRDIAYILNGTRAQFDIIEGGGVDFWLKRGAAYTVDFSELRGFPEQRNADTNGTGGIILSHSVGFTKEPYQRVTVGFDGEDSPAIILNMTVVEDVDDIYFSLRDLSYWLGFSVEVERERFYGERFKISTVPQNVATPSDFIGARTFPVGSRQTVDYAHTLIVRTAPRNDSRILTYVHRGGEFEILDYNGRFVQIETAAGRGWIFAGFLSRGVAEPVLTRNDAEITAVLELISGGDDRRGNWQMWVDRELYYSPVITREVVFPVGFLVLSSLQHYEDGVRLFGGLMRGYELRAFNAFHGAIPTPTMPLKMTELEPKIFELRYDLTRPVLWVDHGDVWLAQWSEWKRAAYENRRIIVNTNELPVQTIRYYIGETPHDLIRNDASRSRYTVEKTDDGIRLAWQLPIYGFFHDGVNSLRLYRSEIRGERGELVRENFFDEEDDNWQFEFFDTNVKDGTEYFYSLAYVTWGNEEKIFFGGDWQMRARRASDADGI